MRLDKFLKNTRLIKRREMANQFCDAGLVELNERAAKAASPIKAGDILVLRFGNRTLKVEVLGIPMRALGTQAEAEDYIKILEDIRLHPTAYPREDA